MRSTLLLPILPGIAMAAASGTSAVKQLESFWIDPTDVLDQLDEYKVLWVKPNGCVWSECAVDDTDDSVVGDNRDGDEQWYQYRTQEFCANAAYSLYGAKKGEVGLFGCTRGHFINSFFTYGGADNLLKAVGVTPTVYYDGYGDDNNNNNNNNGDYSQNTNAMCQEIEADDDQANGQDEESHSGDENSLVSTMGCDADGQYIIASFQASTCDGNYFLKTIDSFESYNDQHSKVGCHRLWDQGLQSNYSLSFLLENSWSCDLELYPKGCPDPYGKKERWDFALRTISHGGNAKLAYKNMLYKGPLRILSFVFGALGVAILAFGYYVRNRERVGSKGGKFLGYIRCMWEDVCELMLIAKKSMVRTILAQLETARNHKEDPQEYDSAVTYEKSRKKDTRTRMV